MHVRSGISKQYLSIIQGTAALIRECFMAGMSSMRQSATAAEITDMKMRNPAGGEYTKARILSSMHSAMPIIMRHQTLSFITMITMSAWEIKYLVSRSC